MARSRNVMHVKVRKLFLKKEKPASFVLDIDY